MLVLLFVLVGAAGFGCGGGGNVTQTQSTPPTTPGSYTFVVKATDASANLTISENVNVTVQ
jgi:hypothetical protein